MEPRKRNQVWTWLFVFVFILSILSIGMMKVLGS